MAFSWISGSWRKKVEETLDELGLKQEKIIEELVNLRKDIAKSGKTQFKMNTLNEASLKTNEASLSELREQLRRFESINEGYRHEIKGRAQREVALEIVRKLLPVADALREGVRLLKQGEPGNEQSKSWAYGFGKIYERMEAVLDSMGVAAIPTIGTEFDPNIHLAVEIVPDSSVPNNTVVKELVTGYYFHGAILRYAHVSVAKSESDSIPKDEREKIRTDNRNVRSFSKQRRAMSRKRKMVRPIPIDIRRRTRREQDNRN